MITRACRPVLSSTASGLLDGLQRQQVAVAIEVGIIDAQGELVKITKICIHDLPFRALTYYAALRNGHVKLKKVVGFTRFPTGSLSVHFSKNCYLCHSVPFSAPQVGRHH